jgi:hypothetical protein
MVKLQSRAADYFILTTIIYLLFDGGISFLPLLLFLPTLVCVFSTNRTKNKKNHRPVQKNIGTFFFDLYQVKQIQQILWNTNQTNKTLKD